MRDVRGVEWSVSLAPVASAASAQPRIERDAGIPAGCRFLPRRGAESTPYLLKVTRGRAASPRPTFLKVTMGRAASPFAAAVAATANRPMRPT